LTTGPLPPILPPMKKGEAPPRYGPEVRADARRRFKAGESASSIARSCGINRETIAAWCASIVKPRAVVKVTRQVIKEVIQQSPKVAAWAEQAAETMGKLHRAVAGEAERLADVAGSPADAPLEVAHDRRAAQLQRYHGMMRADLGLDQPGEHRPLVAIALDCRRLVRESEQTASAPDAQVVDVEPTD